jgi:hypothetical protein
MTQPTHEVCERLLGGHIFKNFLKEPIQPELVPRHFNSVPETPERFQYWQHRYCQRCGFEDVRKER